MEFSGNQGRQVPEAVIAFGWETRDLYARWLRSDDPDDLDLLQGPVLHLGSPESELAPALLRLFERLLLTDVDYMSRVRDHYLLFRGPVDAKPGTVERRTAPGKARRKSERRSRGAG